MRFRFRTKKFEALYTDEKDAHKYPVGVVDAFFEVMSIIEAIKDERDLYALKGLHFEKLRGKRKGQHSLRLNDQWRLVVTLERDDEGSCLDIVSLEDYH